jgi:hypothetical protein
MMKPNRTTTGLFAIVLSWALILQIAPFALGANPAELSKHFSSLPQNTFGIVHVGNIPEAISDIRESIFYEFVTAYFQSDEFKAEKEKDPKAAVAEELIFSLLDSVPKALPGELTLAVLTFNKEEQEPEIVLMADLDEKEFNKLVKEVIAPAVGKLGGPEIGIEKSGDFMKIGPEKSDEALFYSIDKGTMTMSPFERSLGLLEAKETLAENVIFRASFEKQPLSPDALIFVNLREIFTFLEMDLRNKFLAISGVGSVAGIAAATRSTDNGAVSELSLYSPERLDGILGLLKRPVAGTGIGKLVPQDYSVMIRLSVGTFSGFYKDLMTLLENSLGEESYFLEDLKSGIKEMEEALDISFEEDFLRTLGGEIGFALKAPKVAGIPEMAAFLEVKDAGKLQELAEKIMPEEVSFTTTKYKEIDIHTTTIEMVQPSYAFVDGYLVVGIAPGVVQDVISTSANGKSLLTKEDYKAVFADLPEKGVMTMYLDTTEILNSVMPLIQSSIENAREAAARARADSGRPAAESSSWATLLTSCQESIQDLHGTGLVVTVDDRNFKIKQFSGMGSMGGGSLMIGASILFPALMRTREQARSTASLHNVKQLGLAMRMYTIDNDEVFAEKLSDFYPDYLSGLGIFQHPSTDNEPITKKEDIDRLTDYAIFPGLSEASPSDFILIYEKDPLSRGGRNVGYIDGSARWLTEEAFQDKMEEQKKRIQEEEK